jgi:homoserine kinase
MMGHTEFTVRAPASSANLGSGFDCAAATLDLWNELQVTAGHGAFEVRGEGADDPGLAGDANLVLRLFREHGGSATEHVDAYCINRIPLARGLGSSSAAAAVGIVAGWTCAGRAWTAHDLFAEIARIDGHPDNAAAVAFGGVNWCMPHAVPQKLADRTDITAVCVVPHRALLTSDSRDVVPHIVPTPRASAHAAAAGMLAAGFVAGNPVWLRAGMCGDKLHEAARQNLVPELAEVRQWCASMESVIGVTLSGAGSTVVAWTMLPQAPVIAAGLRQYFTDRAIVMDVGISPQGTHLAPAS